MTAYGKMKVGVKTLDDAILDIAKDFEDIFGVSQEITLENFKMNKLAELGNSFIALFVPLL